MIRFREHGFDVICRSVQSTGAGDLGFNRRRMLRGGGSAIKTNVAACSVALAASRHHTIGADSLAGTV